MKDITLKYGCNPNQVPARGLMTGCADLAISAL